VLRSLERHFKRALAACLGLLFGSRRAAVFAPGISPRILIIRQHNQLGDMLCVVPLLRALREQYPSSFVALMASPVNYEVMMGNAYIDELIRYDKRDFIGKKGGSIFRFPAFIQRIRSRHFDIAAVPSTVSTSFTSDLIAYLSGARIRIGAGRLDGKDNPSAFFFTHRREMDWRELSGYHQVQRNIDIWPGPLGQTEDGTLEMTLKKDELEEGKSFVDKVKMGFSRVIVYHPGAGKPPNQWPAERFAALADMMSAEMHSATIVTAGPMDDRPVREMLRIAGVHYHLLRNQPIRKIASILHFCDLLVSNDTGMMHVGAAAGCPVLSLFGPTDPEQWAPLGARHRYIRGEGGDISAISLESVAECAREILRAPKDEK